MKIEFKDNKKVITHPSGHVDEYDKEQLEKVKALLIKRTEHIEKQTQKVVQDISKLAT